MYHRTAVLICQFSMGSQAHEPSAHKHQGCICPSASSVQATRQASQHLASTATTPHGDMPLALHEGQAFQTQEATSVPPSGAQLAEKDAPGDYEKCQWGYLP